MAGVDKNIKDEDLWSLFLKGDLKALEILYQRHYELLLNYGFKIYPDREFIKDVIQDLFIKLCQSRNLSETLCVKNYLLRAQRNMIFDKLSSMHLMERIEDLEFNLAVEDSALNILFHNNDEDILLSKKLIQAYRQLPEKQRVTLYLHYVRDLSYNEIAPILTMTPQSVMNLVSKILSKLRKSLQILISFIGL